MGELLDAWQIKMMKFLTTILLSLVFQFANAQIPGTIGFIHKSPRAQSFTLSVSSLDFTSANVTARILNNGIKPVTTSGILWGWSVPTISSYTGITTNGDITGNNYTHQMTGLAIGGTYYVVSYATNEAGTSYSGVVTYIHGTVYNENTGKTWLAANLGATAFPTSMTHTAAYGSLYQWGRLKDGHENPSSAGIGSTNGNDQPNNGGKFINLTYWTGNFGLWQGVSGTNNPCPSGFRLPTQQEFTNELSSLYVLNLTYGGRRYPNGASQQYAGDRGFYWTSSVANGDKPVSLNIRNGVTTSFGNDFNGVGMSVRCIKD